MAPIRRGGPRQRSASPAAGSSSRGRQRTTRTPDRGARTKKGTVTGSGPQGRRGGIQKSKPWRERGSERNVAPPIGGERPGEDVVRDPGKPEPERPAKGKTS